MDVGTQLVALSDPTRRGIWELLRSGPRSVGDVAAQVTVSRPAVSQHLKVLVDADLVSVSPQGTRRIYSVAPSAMSGLRMWIDAQWDDVLDQFEQAAEKELNMATTDQRLPPIIKTRSVPIGIEAAFQLFTDRLDEWWPVESHSINGASTTEVHFEGRVGGRITEAGPDGSVHAWADVLAWNPPERFVLSWHPSEQPVAASTLEVRFEKEGAGRTRVVLEHRGWEEFGAEGDILRKQYDGGWDMVLKPFEAIASS